MYVFLSFMLIISNMYTACIWKCEILYATWKYSAPGNSFFFSLFFALLWGFLSFQLSHFFFLQLQGSTCLFAFSPFCHAFSFLCHSLYIFNYLSLKSFSVSQPPGNITTQLKDLQYSTICRSLLLTILSHQYFCSLCSNTKAQYYSALCDTLCGQKYMISQLSIFLVPTYFHTWIFTSFLCPSSLFFFSPVFYSRSPVITIHIC